MIEESKTTINRNSTSSAADSDDDNICVCGPRITPIVDVWGHDWHGGVKFEFTVHQRSTLPLDVLY